MGMFRYPKAAIGIRPVWVDMRPLPVTPIVGRVTADFRADNRSLICQTLFPTRSRDV